MTRLEFCQYIDIPTFLLLPAEFKRDLVAARKVAMGLCDAGLIFTAAILDFAERRELFGARG